MVHLLSAGLPTAVVLHVPPLPATGDVTAGLPAIGDVTMGLPI